MNRHALRVLEHRSALEGVAELATSALGRDAVLELQPLAELGAVGEELGRVVETRRFLDEHQGWVPPEIPDARRALARLALEGGVLEPAELHSLGVLLGSGRAMREALHTPEEGRKPDVARAAGRNRYPGLDGLAALLVHDAALEGTVARTVDARGAVLDTASRDLRRVRAALRKAHGRIVERLEAFLRSLPGRFVVPDASVTVRDGRYVVPIRREGRGEVGGLVHDESATGATLFVEPPPAIELMNELRELEREEAREVQRILRDLTRLLRPRREALAGTLDALVAFDSLYARARAADAWGGWPPELLAADVPALRIVQGRHPLLLGRPGVEVVPFDLELHEDERALVISGPNTGGKSVLLKAVGLIAALTQSGVVPPVGRGTRLPVFRDVFADIGDEQSIARSLSTYSAHLANLMEIVRGAGPGCLVLIDEMGTGTDPTEGAALARAILETLVSRGSLALVTSHLGALKRLDVEGSGIVNASLQFDPDRMEPTYLLVKGRPGRSYGLAIARRLGLPADVLDRAEGYVPGGEASVEDLLEKLERREKETRALVESLTRKEAEAGRLEEELRRREAELRELERDADRRTREAARRLLLEARSEVETAIREVKEAASAGGDVDAASHRARRRVEEAVRRQGSGSSPGSSAPAAPAYQPRPGDRVRLAEGGARGTVREVRDGRVLVEASGLKLQVPPGELIPAERGAEGIRGAAEARPASAGGWTGPDVDPSPEVDLRGLRVEEVELDLARALDEAVLGDLRELRVIHGKGTGALRQRVSELLREDARVREFRSGLPGEGGHGVTVVRLR